jgi:hypothetical protein
VAPVGPVPADEGALVERSLVAARQSLEDEGAVGEPSWADALVSVADRSLGGGAPRPARDRHLVLVHVGSDGHGTHGHLHLGPPLPDSLRRRLGCDGRVRAVAERDGVAVSVGRTRRIVPERTRVAVEERDGGCRVPGCDRTRWLESHHVRHWEDGGATDTSNLVALCSRHHRLHHLGHLHITGDADRPDGLVMTDRRGRRLTGCGRPAPPPAQLPVTGHWRPPTGEPFDPDCVYFGEPSR